MSVHKRHHLYEIYEDKARRVRGGCSEDCGVQPLVQRLQTALAMLDDLELRAEKGDGGCDVVARRKKVKDPRPFQQLCELYVLLQDIERRLPHVEGWALVMGDYPPKAPDEPFQPWVHSMWATKEQAEKMAPVVAAAYAKQARHTQDRHPDAPGYFAGHSSRITVEWRETRITSVMNPKLTPAEEAKTIC